MTKAQEQATTSDTMPNAETRTVKVVSTTEHHTYRAPGDRSRTGRSNRNRTAPQLELGLEVGQAPQPRPFIS